MLGSAVLYKNDIIDTPTVSTLGARTTRSIVKIDNYKYAVNVHSRVINPRSYVRDSIHLNGIVYITITRQNATPSW